jgi:Tfp pilus assembly protein PilF
LIDASKGSHLWSQRYDRELTDVFTIQDEIASAIANTLQSKLLVNLAIKRNCQPNQVAYEAYLKARYLWGKLDAESLKRCKTFLEEAIQSDPDFAQAHCGYADYFLFQGSAYKQVKEVVPIIREEARKALDIDPSLREAHAMLGIAASLDLDWREAERCFRSALAGNSVPPQVCQWYGWFYLQSIGRIKEAVERQEQGVKADPINIVARTCLAFSLLFDGRLVDAELEAKKALELDVNYGTAAVVMALRYAEEERWADALFYAEKAAASVSYSIGILSGVLRRIGQINRAAELTQKLLPGETRGDSIGLFYYYYVSGEIGEAVKWMEKAIDCRDMMYILAPSHFRFTSLWPEIAKLMKVPTEGSI